MLTPLLCLAAALAAPAPLYVPPTWAEAEAPAWDGAAGLLLSGSLTRDGEPLAPGTPLWEGERLRVEGEATVLLATRPTPLRLSPGSWRVEAEGRSSADAATPEPWIPPPHLPRDRGSFVAQYDALGLPRTPAAWGWQDRVDGGSLAAARDRLLAARLEAAGGVEAPPNLGLLAQGRGSRALAETLLAPPAPTEAHSPSPLCPQGEVLLLELFPTASGAGSSLRAAPRTVGRALTLRGPDEWRADAVMGYIRLYSAMLGDALRGVGCRVRAWPVPYANTVENIVLRRGEPRDGAENLRRLLARAPAGLGRAAIGYSQGGGALRAALARHGDALGLDLAVILGPMGGVDGAGGRGLWSGQRGRTLTLAVSHTLDPAADIPAGVGLIRLTPGMLNFFRDPGRGGTRWSLHSLWYGWEDDGADPTLGLDAGIFGYPAALVRPLLDELVGGLHDAPYGPRGAWEHDLRLLLVDPPEDLRTLRVEAQGLVAAYRPSQAASAGR